jgi:hypothetical protein
LQGTDGPGLGRACGLHALADSGGLKRPRVYGDETRCGAAVARDVKAAELLDQADGVRNRIATATADRPDRASYTVRLIESEWADQVRRWFNTARRDGAYLQEQLEEVMPVLALGLPPPTGKPRHHVGLDNGEPWLREALKSCRRCRRPSA